jgi:hypothetical protein
LGGFTVEELNDRSTATMYLAALVLVLWRPKSKFAKTYKFAQA